MGATEFPQLPAWSAGSGLLSARSLRGQPVAGRHGRGHGPGSQWEPRQRAEPRGVKWAGPLAAPELFLQLRCGLATRALERR